MKSLSAVTTFGTAYPTIDSRIADIYINVLKYGLRACAERKDGFIDVYCLYDGTTWVGVFEKRLEAK
jgi:hypothetical protein